MKPVLVIGVGNRLREDDGMGCRAAELLEDRLTPGSVEVAECHQLTPELVSTMAEAQMVLFLDAAVDQAPGAIRSRRVPTRNDPQHGWRWTHQLSPRDLMDLTKAIHGRAPLAFLITGGAARTGFLNALTPQGESCAQRMAEVAAGLVSSIEEAVAGPAGG